jgi:hypothetical protein
MITRAPLLTAGRYVLAAALLLTAGLMWSWLPTKVQSWAPIEVPGTVGQHVAGRDLAVTVQKVYLAHEVTAHGNHGLNRFPSKGVWLVMMISYEALHEPQKPAFQLRADGRTFSTNISGIGSRISQPAAPSRGPIAFELPAAPRSATLLVANRLTDNNYQEMIAPLDSQIAVRIPLAGQETQASLNLSELSWQ